MLYAEIICKLLLKLSRKPSCRKPEIKHGIGKRHHFLLVKDSTAVVDSVSGFKRFLSFKLFIICLYERFYLLSRFAFTTPHNFTPISSKVLFLRLSFFPEALSPEYYPYIARTPYVESSSVPQPQQAVLTVPVQKRSRLHPGS